MAVRARVLLLPSPLLLLPTRMHSAADRDRDRPPSGLGGSAKRKGDEVITPPRVLFSHECQHRVDQWLVSSPLSRPLCLPLCAFGQPIAVVAMALSFLRVRLSDCGCKSRATCLVIQCTFLRLSAKTNTPIPRGSGQAAPHFHFVCFSLYSYEQGKAVPSTEIDRVIRRHRRIGFSPYVHGMP